jgi:hypothetical protein
MSIGWLASRLSSLRNFRALRTDRHAAIAQRADQLLRIFQLVFDQRRRMTASCGIYASPYCSMTCGNGLKRYQKSAKRGKPIVTRGLARLAGQLPHQAWAPG